MPAGCPCAAIGSGAAHTVDVAAVATGFTCTSMPGCLDSFSQCPAALIHCASVRLAVPLALTLMHRRVVSSLALAASGSRGRDRALQLVAAARVPVQAAPHRSAYKLPGSST